MMCWPSGVTATARTGTACPLKVWTSVPSTWYSRTSPALGPAAKADHKVHAVGQRRDAIHLAAHLEGALELAAEGEQLRGLVLRAADEARAARQHRYRIDPGCVRLDGAHELVAAPHLDGLVVRAGEDVAVVRRRHAVHPVGVPGEREHLRRVRPRNKHEPCGVAQRAAQTRQLRDVVGEEQAVEDEGEELAGQVDEVERGVVERGLARELARELAHRTVVRRQLDQPRERDCTWPRARAAARPLLRAQHVVPRRNRDHPTWAAARAATAGAAARPRAAPGGEPRCRRAGRGARVDRRRRVVPVVPLSPSRGSRAGAETDWPAATRALAACSACDRDLVRVARNFARSALALHHVLAAHQRPRRARAHKRRARPARRPTPCARRCSRRRRR